MGAADGLAEDSRARRPRRRTAVLPTVIVAASVRVVASGGPIIVVAPSPADHIVVALRLASVAEAVVHRGDPIGRRDKLRPPYPAEAVPWEVLRCLRTVERQNFRPASPR